MKAILRALRARIEDVESLLFPQVCHSCHRRVIQSAPLCELCEPRLCLLSGSLCYACYPNKVLSWVKSAEGTCEAPGHKNFRVASGLLLRGPATDLIHAFKYAGAKGLAPFLAGLCIEAFRGLSPAAPDLLLPVPLHASRLRRRGYNQSTILAEEITRLTGVMTAPGLLMRSRATRPQVELDPVRRATNVEGAFLCPFPGAVEGKTITIVDDVATTGATLRGCAKALLEAGAHRVTALVAAIS